MIFLSKEVSVDTSMNSPLRPIHAVAETRLQLHEGDSKLIADAMDEITVTTHSKELIYSPSGEPGTWHYADECLHIDSSEE
jgi:hypothetical protein